jgi:uncharacterized protein (TIGR02266 family)
MKKKEREAQLVKLPILFTKEHEGSSLVVDRERETISLVGPEGESLGTVPWEAVIGCIRKANEKARTVEMRAHPRISLLFKVRYRTPEGVQLDGQASGISGGGLFIESTSPQPKGTHLSLAFALPDRPAEWLEAKGEVAWICPQRDQYTASPGMGIKFTEIAPKVRDRILELVNSIRKSDPGNTG